jgi:glycosyltransferase involved in cell wall biosynthesis
VISSNRKADVEEQAKPHSNTIPWIAYVGPFQYPWGQAGSRRVYGVARSLIDAGYNVVVASGSREPSFVEAVLESSAGTVLSHIGLAELPQEGETRIQKIKKVLLTWGRRTASWLDAQIVRPSHVIVYGGSAQYMHNVGSWCRQHGVPLIVDVVEWYDPRQLQGGTFGPVHLSAKVALRYQYPRASGVIAISSLLEQYYGRRGCPTLRIPPTLDVLGLDLHRKPREDGKLQLSYCGTPGKKDLLGNILAGVERVDPDGDRIEFQVVGPTADEVVKMTGRRSLPQAVTVIGRRPQQEVSEIVKKCDFSVLLREPRRFTHAGFPTKFCESLSVGTPAIANLTGDLGAYLRDGREGIICSDHSADSFAVALRRALELDNSRLNAMRQAARSQAIEAFDFRSYSDPLRRLLAEQTSSDPRVH